MAEGSSDQSGTDAALTAFLDLLFEERGHQPIAACRDSYESIRGAWFDHLMPAVERIEVAGELADDIRKAIS
jgi:5-methylcytosine-specific restriction enzyme B